MRLLRALRALAMTILANTADEKGFLGNQCDTMANPDITIKERAVLFADVHSFAQISHVLGVDAYGFLQEMYEILGDIVVEHGGAIVKYLGDALLCVFPADVENKAIDCALKLRPAFAQLVSRRGLSVETELEIGIASGQVASGTFGHPTLLQWDVLGEEVNLAATIGHHRGIAITERVHDRVKSNYSTRRLPDFNVKWQTEPLQVWEVVESPRD
jgi:class 3 adenylate cyclase